MFHIPFPNVLERRTGFLMLGWLNNPTITGYRLLVADTLNEAYGFFNGVPGGAGPQPAFDLSRGECRITSTILRRGNILRSDTVAGQTRLIYDPNQLIGVVPGAPPDDQAMFLRAQVTTVASPTFPAPTNTTMSDILVVPPYNFNSSFKMTFTATGIAPDVGAILGDPAPNESMFFHLPNFIDGINLNNHGPGNLFFSAGRNLPMIRVPAGGTYQINSGANDLVVAGNGSNPEWSMIVSMYSGII